MKIITLLCTVLWGAVTLFDIYDMTMGSYPIAEIFSESTGDGIFSVLWFFVYVVTTIFFYIFWKKQN